MACYAYSKESKSENGNVKRELPSPHVLDVARSSWRGWVGAESYPFRAFDTWARSRFNVVFA